MTENKEWDFSGGDSVSKDIDHFTDVLAKQLYLINQAITASAGNNFIENAINVLEANLSPYLPESYNEEISVLEQKTAVKLRLLRSDVRYMREQRIFRDFFLKKYSLILKYAKEKGFLPKNLKWEY